MKLHQLGEFGLIHHFAPRFLQHLPPDIQGIGDDCAIMPYKDEHSLLVTTDMLIENVHFLTSKISPEDLGHKSLAVNLSDIAAMGGRPLYAFLSIGLPPTLEVSWLDRFFDGLEKLAKEENVLLLGGDTTSSLSGFIVNIVILGEAKNSQIKKRSQAVAGDLICCTGPLGSSGAGLKVLLEDLPIDEMTEVLVHSHHHPRPHLKEGQWLAAHPAVHAMIDVSDGIDSDVRRLMEQSHCGAEIDLNQLPLTTNLIKASERFGWNVEELAVTAGEDYCLLFTVDPKEYFQLQKEYETYFQSPLPVIGKITSHPLTLLYLGRDRKPVTIQKKGFDHFHKDSLSEVQKAR